MMDKLTIIFERNSINFHKKTSGSYTKRHLILDERKAPLPSTKSGLKQIEND